MAEIVVIVVAALIFVGPDKLPGMAKSMGKTIRDLRRQTRDLRQVIERDTEIGDAVRELRSAMHDEPPRPMPPVSEPTVGEHEEEAGDHATPGSDSDADPDDDESQPTQPKLSDEERAVLQAMIDDDSDPFPDIDPNHNEPEEPESLIKPANDTIARGEQDPDDEH